MILYLPMYSSQQKRKKRVPAGAGQAKKPFRAPRPAQRQASVIPGLLYQTQSEKKVLGVTSTSVAGNLALNTTGTIQAINLIQVGSSMFNRIGRKIEMRSVRLVLNLNTLNVTRATIDCDIGRVMIIYDRQTNGANPAMADILQYTDQTGTNVTWAMAGLNMNNRERFVTILDQKIMIPQATATAGVLTNVFPQGEVIPVNLDEFRKLKGLTTHFKADSNPAVIGDIATGGLFLISLSNTQVAGTELFNYNFDVRLKYVDV